MVRRHSGMARAVVVAALVAVLGWASVGAAQVQSPTLQLPTFMTVGLGYVVVEADRVVVSLGVEATGDSAAEAQMENERLVSAIEERVKALQLEGMEFGYRRVDVRQQRTGPVRRDEGAYRASSGLDVTVVDERDVGRVIDAAMAAGAATVQGVSFRSSHLEAAAKEALGLAVKDAMAKAQAISEATGMRVVMTRRVTDGHNVEIINPSDPVLVEAGAAARPPYHVPVQRGEILVQVEVTAEFEVGI